MGKTLLCIDTYAKISPFLKFAWPYYERAGFDIVGIQRTNSPTQWPNGVNVVSSGEDAFMAYADLIHTHQKNLLVNRWLDIILKFIESPEFSEYTDFCLIEWDLLPLKRFPAFDEELGLCLNMVGGRPPEAINQTCRSPYLFHMPWWMDRKRGGMIRSKAGELIAKGHTENGSFDWMLGLIVSELNIKWQRFDGFSLNKFDSDWAIREARKAIAAGTYSIHGCQTKEQLEAVFSP